MKDIWLVDVAHEFTSGSYSAGVIAVVSLDLLTTIAHEYCHAHQDWAVDSNAYSSITSNWPQSAEGRAFLAAWEADRATGERFILDRDRRNRGPLEAAASVCAVYNYTFEGGFETMSRQFLRDRLPHLYAWAEEWLRWP